MTHWYTPPPGLLLPKAARPVPPTSDPVAWVQLKLNWQPDPIQSEILRTSAHRLMLCCTRQWGKSTVTAIKALHHAWYHSGSLVIVAAPTARQSGFFYNEWHRTDEVCSWQRTQVPADRCPRISSEFLAQQRISLGDQM